MEEVGSEEVVLIEFAGLVEKCPQATSGLLGRLQYQNDIAEGDAGLGGLDNCIDPDASGARNRQERKEYAGPLLRHPHLLLFFEVLAQQPAKTVQKEPVEPKAAGFLYARARTQEFGEVRCHAPGRSPGSVQAVKTIGKIAPRQSLRQRGQQEDDNGNRVQFQQQP